MDSVSQTLRKARQVDQKFKSFMAQKDQRDRSMQQTMNKIKQTQQTIAKTKSTISSIDQLYDNFQKRFSEAINSALSGVEKNLMLNVADPNWKPNKINQKQFVQNLKKSKQIVFLTGAGISAASGIPTFRGAKGFWDKQNLKNQISEDIKTPEQILTLSYFQKNQFATWKWLIDFSKIKQKAKVNKGHTGLHTIMSQIINANKNTLLVTQNIDDFHIEAMNAQKQKRKGLKQYKICEIHGNINKIRCDNCSQLKKQIQFYDFKDHIKQVESKEHPKCSKCGNDLRPHIMFFDEVYTELYNQIEKVKNFSKQCDLLVVIGTALQTGLARDIVQSALIKNVTIIQINLQCEIKKANTLWLQGKADEIIDKIKYELWKKGL